MTPLAMNDVARLVARDIPAGAYVNLGIGMPTLVANHVAADREVIYHSENGILGVGPTPLPGQENPELINASKQLVTLVPGGSYFDNAQSFGIMRGGHLDIAVLGAYQVSQRGDLANWATGAEHHPPAVGGAMDLAVGAKQVFVLMRHSGPDGTPKILAECSYPLTGAGVVTRIYTDLAVIHVTGDGLCVRELHPGIDFDFVQRCTAAALIDATASALRH